MKTEVVLKSNDLIKWWSFNASLMKTEVVLKFKKITWYESGKIV